MNEEFTHSEWITIVFIAALLAALLLRALWLGIEEQKEEWWRR